MNNIAEQGGIEWLMERCGKVTCSNFKHVMDMTKAGKRSAKGYGYLMDVVQEMITGKPVEHYMNDAMLHGTEYEPIAKMAYEAQTGNMVVSTGFANHLTLEGVGGSADGLLGEDGIIEIKCPTTRTHMETLLGEFEHEAQIQGLLWVLNRDYCDFVSYDDRMPDKLQLYIKRINRDDAYIAALEAGVIAFLAEVQVMVTTLNSTSNRPNQQSNAPEGA